VACSLAYSIKSVVEKEAVLTYKGETEPIDFGTIEGLIVSEFWYAMNRRGWVGKETEELIAYTLDRLAFYRSPESGRTKMDPHIFNRKMDEYVDEKSPKMGKSEGK
jgi:hypothetical protein